MKILAIRGQNLTSLAGDWEIRFDSGPLAKAGTFAITGPTGAGKSTIFDALCLALFGRTPRYDAKGGYDVGAEDEDPNLKLKSGDPRGIVRRGTGEGFAEVEFVGIDGGEYLARWYVNRAGKSPRGRMQNAVHTVHGLVRGTGGRSPQPLASGMQDVAKFMDGKLGLKLDEFTRAVLLPQGDFAAFLRAKPDMRAMLLEKVTDSSIYGKIGALVFERARSAAQALQLKEADVGGISVLDSPVRKAIEAEKAVLAAQIAVKKDEADRARAVESWFVRQAELAGLVQGAIAGLAIPQAAVDDALPRRQRLSQIDAAEPFRKVVEAAANAAQTAERDRVAASDCATQQAAAAAEAATSNEVEKKAADEARLAKEALAQKAPELQKARTLDQTIQNLAAAAEKQARQAADLQREQQAIVATRDRQLQALADAKTRVDEIVVWRTAHPEVAQLADGWVLTQSRIADFALAKEATRKLAASRPAAAATAAAATAAHAAAIVLAGEARLAAAKAKEIRTGAQSAFDQLPDTAKARSELAVRRTALENLMNIAESADRLRGDCETQRAAKDTATANAATHRTAALAAQALANTISPRLEEVKYNRDRCTVEASLSDHRATLVDGKACPLCGAHEHPYATNAPDGQSALARLNQRVKELENELAAANADVSAQAARASGLEAEGARAEAALNQKLNELEVRGKEWAGANRTGEPTVSSLAADRAELVAHDATLADDDRKRSDALAALKVAHEAEERAHAAQTTCEESLNAAEKSQEQAVAALQTADAEAARQASARDAALSHLRAILDATPGWEALLEADPVGFSAARAEDVAALGKLDAEKAELTLKIAAGDAQLGELMRSIEAGANALTGAKTETAQTEAELGAKRLERAALLGGQAADTVEAARRQADGLAATAAEAARTTAEKGRTKEAEWTGKREESTRVHKVSAELAEATAAQRDAALGDRPLPEITALLSENPAATEIERKSIRAIDDALAAAINALRSRQTDLATHESSGRPLGTHADASAAREALDAERDAANTKLGVIAAQLTSDDENQQRRDAAGAEIAALKHRNERWAKLRDLIGDKEGKNFRVFAQSITLDVLVGQANVHLSRLAGRYRLSRVPGAELELQIIDRDSADDIRPLTSLSGGETFLASLALALGLSSMVTKNLHIGSLFIDEGFGTLDAATLGHAMGVLGGLHAEGRQVGVISHVEGLAEQLGAWVAVDKVNATKSVIRVGSGVRSGE